MDATKQAWVERCTRRLTELQPLLRPRIAQVVAEELWRGERGHISPEEWAEIEVQTWGRRKPPEGPQLERRRPSWRPPEDDSRDALVEAKDRFASRGQG